MIRRRAVLALPGAAAGHAAMAQSPSRRSVRIVVPYAPGGPLDIVARMVAERMAPALGVTVAVENRGGGAGVVAADAVAKAAPDGTTLLAAVPDVLINNAAMLPDLPYDPRRDFSFVSQLCSAPLLLLAHPSLGARDLPSLDAALRARGREGRGGGAYGSYGPGSLPHLMCAALDRRYGWGLDHAGYRGEAPMLLDLLSGTLPIGMASVANTADHVARGSLVPIALSGPARSPASPGVPTFAEAGLDEPILGLRIWIGLVAPAGLPGAVLDRLSGAASGAVRAPEVAGWMADRALDPIGNGPAAFEAAFRRDFDAITGMIRAFGITAPG